MRALLPRCTCHAQCVGALCQLFFFFTGTAPPRCIHAKPSSMVSRPTVSWLLNAVFWCPKILPWTHPPLFFKDLTLKAVLRFLTWLWGLGTELVSYWNIQSLAIYKHLLSIEGELLLANCCRAPTETHTHRLTHSHVNAAFPQTKTLRLILMKQSRVYGPAAHLRIFSSQFLHFLQVDSFCLWTWRALHLLRMCVCASSSNILVVQPFPYESLSFWQACAWVSSDSCRWVKV